jgi:hypothetical protein
MDAQGTMRLMFDTMDAYDRADFDRLAEIYAKDARWVNNVDSNGPHCRNRDDIFSMFRQRMNAGVPNHFDRGLLLDGSRRGGDGGPKPGTRLSGGGVAGDASGGRS